MNHNLVYEPTKLRHAELVDEARRSQTFRFRGFRNDWTRMTVSARQRVAVLAEVLTSRTRSTKAA